MRVGGREMAPALPLLLDALKGGLYDVVNSGGALVELATVIEVFGKMSDAAPTLQQLVFDVSNRVGAWCLSPGHISLVSRLGLEPLIISS